MKQKLAVETDSILDFRPSYTEQPFHDTMVQAWNASLDYSVQKRLSIALQADCRSLIFYLAIERNLETKYFARLL